MARKPRGKLAENLADHAGPDHDKETIEKLAEAAKAANAKAGHNSGNPPPEVLKRNSDAIELGLREIHAAQKLVQAARANFATTRSTAETDTGSKGCVNSIVKAVKMDLEAEKGGAGEQVTEHRQIGAVLRARNSPLGTQWNLFAMPDEEATEGGNGKVAAMDAELQGQHAYSNSEPLTNNPFDPVTQAELYNDWRHGWVQAQNAKARSMGMGGEGAAH
jgi:hypothetical protein